MITETLISEEVWAEAPSDSKEAFIYIVSNAQKALKKILEDDNGNGAWPHEKWRNQYIVEVVALSEELGIEGLPNATSAISTPGSKDAFDANLALVFTRIKASNRSIYQADSVALRTTTKQRIRSQIEILRDLINRSNLSDTLRESLHKKVNDVEKELDRRRSNLRPIWILAGSIGTVGALTISTLADLPAALESIEQITTLVNGDRASEENSRARLNEPDKIDFSEPLKITDQSNEK